MCKMSRTCFEVSLSVFAAVGFGLVGYFVSRDALKFDEDKAVGIALILGVVGGVSTYSLVHFCSGNRRNRVAVAPAPPIMGPVGLAPAAVVVHPAVTPPVSVVGLEPPSIPRHADLVKNRPELADDSKDKRKDGNGKNYEYKGQQIPPSRSPSMENVTVTVYMLLPPSSQAQGTASSLSAVPVVAAQPPNRTPSPQATVVGIAPPASPFQVDVMNRVPALPPGMMPPDHGAPEEEAPARGRTPPSAARTSISRALTPISPTC